MAALPRPSTPSALVLAKKLTRFKDQLPKPLWPALFHYRRLLATDVLSQVDLAALEREVRNKKLRAHAQKLLHIHFGGRLVIALRNYKEGSLQTMLWLPQLRRGFWKPTGDKLSPRLQKFCERALEGMLYCAQAAAKLTSADDRDFFNIILGQPLEKRRQRGAPKQHAKEGLYAQAAIERSFPGGVRTYADAIPIIHRTLQQAAPTKHSNEATVARRVRQYQSTLGQPEGWKTSLLRRCLGLLRDTPFQPQSRLVLGPSMVATGAVPPFNLSTMASVILGEPGAPPPARTSQAPTLKAASEAGLIPPEEALAHVLALTKR